MKKKWLVNSLCLCLLIALSGCVFSDEPTENEDPIQFSLIEGTGGTAYSILANGIAYAVESSYPNSIVSISLGAPSTNPLRVNNYSADFGLTSSASAHDSYYGLNGFEKTENLRIVATFNKSVLHFALSKKFGIKTFDEFISQKPKARIRVPLGTSIGVIFDQMLNEYNLTRSDMEVNGMELIDVEQSSIAEMISQGYLDGYFTSSSMPSSLVTQTFSGSDMELIDIGSSLVQSINIKYGHGVSTIKKSIYSFLERDITSITTYVVLVTNDKVPDETVYKLSKALNENLAYIRTIMADLSEFETASYIESFNIPIHPGARKYYEEIGIELPEE